MLQLNISTLFNSYTTYENCINIFYIISKYRLRPFNVLIFVLCIYAVAYYMNKITNSDTIIVIPPFFKYQSIPFSYGISIFFVLVNIHHLSSILLHRHPYFSSVTMSDIPPPTILVPFSANLPVTDHSTTTSNTDPCVIHHSDNPSTVLITLLLTGDNYGSWSRK
jgi:hypothetical protein